MFTADVMKETFDRTALGSVGAGEPVNLERAATAAHPPRRAHRAGPRRRGGHDPVREAPGERWDDVRIALPPRLARYVVEKGSISVDGISLTVVAVDADVVHGEPDPDHARR